MDRCDRTTTPRGSRGCRGPEGTGLAILLISIGALLGSGCYTNEWEPVGGPGGSTPDGPSGDEGEPGTDVGDPSSPSSPEGDPAGEDSPAGHEDDPAPTEDAADVYELRYRPTSSERFAVLGDGAVLGALSDAALDAIASTTWELYVELDGLLLVAQGGSLEIDGVELPLSLCGELSTSLIACGGDLACWNDGARAPAGAPELGCRPLRTPPVCDTMPVPTAPLVLAAFPSGINVAESTVWTIDLVFLGEEVEFTVWGEVEVQDVTLTRSGAVEEQWPSPSVDWRHELGRLRGALASVGGWDYARAECTGTFIDPSCTDAETALTSCLAAFLDGASPAACFDALDAFTWPLYDDPWDMDAYCVAR